FDRIEGAKEFMDGKAAGVSGIKADGLTLKITLAEPFGPFLGLLAMPGAYVVPKEEVEKWGEDFSDHPAGTGPYVLKEWKHGSRLLLEARGDYFGEKPQVAGIYYRVIPEELTSVAEFERGNLDMIGVPASEYRRYTTDPTRRGRILAQVGMNTYYMGMNCSRPPFDNLKLRQAASTAVDRGRLLSTIMEGRGLLADGPVPPVLLPGIKGGAPAFDPEGARRLVKEAGFPDGVDIKFYIGPEQETLDMAEVIQQYLAAAGIRAHITQLEWSAYKQAINNGDADAFWMSWQADYPDPENFLYPVFFSKNAGAAGNRARIDDPEFDRLITLAQKEPDESKRMALYADAQARIVMAAPWVFFWHKKDVVAVQPWVRGAALYPINNADKGLGIALERR
ncbi:MAG TPA: ABC transporter substrate-binding protein, partial [Nitrospirota bacterium]